MKQQTAVDFLFEKIKSNIDSEDGSMCMNWLYDDTLKEAKEMEKKQIIDANNRGYEVRKLKINETAQDYYNEKYKKS